MPQRKLLSFLQSSAISNAVIFCNPKYSSFRVNLRRKICFPEKKKKKKEKNKKQSPNNTLITSIRQATNTKQHTNPKGPLFQILHVVHTQQQLISSLLITEFIACIQFSLFMVSNFLKKNVTCQHGYGT